MKTLSRSPIRCGLLTLLMAATAAVATSAQTPTPSPNGKIAFVSDRDGNYEIYVMEANGSSPTRLTNNPAFDFGPAWSPDGTKIAFQTDRDGNYEIYVMDANGSNPVNLTNDAFSDFSPAWSPDGAKIVFISLRSDDFKVWVMNADGSNPTALTDDNKARDLAPAWSSTDLNKIAYQSQSLLNNDTEVWVMDANGSNKINLTNNPTTSDGEPAWSPDGEKIAFSTLRTGNDEIYVMEANGSNPINLTNHLSSDSRASWSPDGTKIAFSSHRDGNYEIYVMDANGANPTRLTNNPADDSKPHWQRIAGFVTPTPIPTVTPTATPTPTPPTPTPTVTPATPTPTPPGTPTPTATPTPGVCSWSFGPAFPIPITSQAVTSLGGNLYSFGGTTTGNVQVANAYRFDGSTWIPVAPLPQALAGASAVNDGTSIYVVGGFAGAVGHNTLYRYNPGANSYTTLAPLATASASHGAAYLGGKIYKFASSSATEIYDIATNQWTAGADYPQSAYAVHAFAHGNFIYGAGGRLSFPLPIPLSSTYRYDPTTNTWDDAAIADLPEPRAGAASGPYNGGWVLAGGSQSGPILASAISWNPNSNTWSSLPFMLAARMDMGGAALNGSFYVVGGGSLQTSSTNDNQRLTCPAAPTPTPTPTSTPITPTPTPTPPPTTPTPSPTPAAQAINLSTRMRVLTGDNVGIGGFIITGSAPKHVLIRAIGPSLTDFGVADALPDTLLELHGPGGFVTVINNNWRDDPAQEALILATGIPPANDLESAIDATLNPGAYTAVVRGNNNTTGVALIEVYDLGHGASAKLANISTRAFVSTGNDIVIAGFILGSGSGNDRIVVRGLGPSLSDFGVPDVLANPTLELRDSNGTLLIANNDWQDDPIQASEITSAGLALGNNLESGIAATLPPGAYTALLAGLNNGTGNGVVEVYDRGAP